MRQSWPQASPSAAPAPAADPLPAGVVIEPARLRDLPALAELQRRAFPLRLAYTTGTLALLWALPWVRLLVARRGKGIAGCIIGDRVIDGGRVINLAVDPDARRQGIGTALLAEIERALPVDTMTLMVQIENDGAQTLYRAVGYAEEATLPNYYGPGRAGVRMRKRLGEGDRGIGGRGGEGEGSVGSRLPTHDSSTLSPASPPAASLRGRALRVADVVGVAEVATIAQAVGMDAAALAPAAAA
jgi:ribosomal-protein-alanine N-acetyltransferase